MFTLLRSLLAGAPKAAPSERPSTRPSLEALEDRAAPALIASHVLPPLVRRPGGVGGVGGVFRPPFVRPGPGPAQTLPPGAMDCINEFKAMNVASPEQGKGKGQGRGQVKYFICHFTNSATNPHNIQRIAAPAAFGGHLRHGDLIFTTKVAATGQLQVFVTFQNSQGQIVTSGPF